jgi:hypothetical protein
MLLVKGIKEGYLFLLPLGAEHHKRAKQRPLRRIEQRNTTQILIHPFPRNTVQHRTRITMSCQRRAWLQETPPEITHINTNLQLPLLLVFALFFF